MTLAKYVKRGKQDLNNAIIFVSGWVMIVSALWSQWNFNVAAIFIGVSFMAFALASTTADQLARREEDKAEAEQPQPQVTQEQEADRAYTWN